MDTQSIKPLIDSVLRLALAQKINPLAVINTFSTGAWEYHLRDDYPLFKELMLNYMEEYERRYLK